MVFSTSRLTSLLPLLKPAVTVCAELTGILFVADLEARTLQQLIPHVGMFVKGIGQDADGELYVIGSTIEGPSGNAGVIAQLRSIRDRGGDRD